jgi:hypothetical protein
MVLEFFLFYYYYYYYYYYYFYLLLVITHASGGLEPMTSPSALLQREEVPFELKLIGHMILEFYLSYLGHDHKFWVVKCVYRYVIGKSLCFAF